MSTTLEQAIEEIRTKREARMSKEDGGPAFPHDVDWVSNESNAQRTRWSGMSLRDYFAAQSLCGLSIWDSIVNVDQGRKSAFAGHGDELARAAYYIADAMLAERAK